MADKPVFSAVTGFQGGVSVGISTDTWEQFVHACEQVWPGEGADVAQGLYLILKGNALTVGPSEAEAQAMLESQLGAVPLPPEPGQGYAQQPQPQPQYQQQPPVQGQGFYQNQQVQPGYQQQGYGQQYDPNGPPPGQTHDPNDPEKTKWVKPGVIKNGPKAGQSYPGFWAYPDGHPKARRR